MASKVRQITIPVAFRTNTKALSDAEGAFAKFASGVGAVAAAAVTAVAAIGAAAVRTANDFEQSFAKIQGLVGLSASEIGELEQAAARLGPQFGRSALEAADALFFITSAGLRGADAVGVLEASLQAAAAGLGNTKEIANIATASVNVYGSAVLSGKDAVDALAEAVRLGQFAPEELAGALGKVIPVSAELGVSFQEVTGFVAALTRGGLNAAEAVTGIRGVMTALIRPTAEAEEALGTIGITAEELRTSVEQDGLLNTLIMLREGFGSNEDAITRVFGSIEGLNAVLSLTGENSATYVDIIRQMTDNVGVLDDAFGVMEETAGFKFSKAIETARAALLPLGDTLLDIGARMLDALMPTIESLAPVFEEMFVALEEPLNQIIAILPSFVNAFLPLMPILGQIAAIFAQLVVAFMPVFTALMQALVPILEAIIPPLAIFIEELMASLGPLLVTLIETLTPLIMAILPVFLEFWNLISPLILYFVEVFTPIIESLLPLLTITLETIVLPILQMFAEWMGTLLPAAAQALIDSGLLPSAEAMAKWGEAFSKIVSGVRTFVAEGMNVIIGALEKAANAAIDMINRLIAAGKALPGAAGALFAGIKPIGNVTFQRVEVPGAYDYLTFPEVDVSGITDQAERRYGRQTFSGGGMGGISNIPAPRRGFYTDTFGNTVFGNIPAFAKGGIVMGPTFGLIGEAGPEAVIPLDKLERPGNTYNITIQAGVGDPVRIGEQVVSYIKKYERASGQVFVSA